MQPEPNTDSTSPESIQEDPTQPNHANTTTTQTSQEENTQTETAGSNSSGSPAEADTELQKGPSSEGHL